MAGNPTYATNGLETINHLINIKNSMQALKNLNALRAYTTYNQVVSLWDQSTQSNNQLKNGFYQATCPPGDFFRQMNSITMTSLRKDKNTLNTIRSFYNCDTNMLPDLRKKSGTLNSVKTITDPYKTLTACSFRSAACKEMLTSKVSDMQTEADEDKTQGDKENKYLSKKLQLDLTVVLKKREKSRFLLTKGCSTL